MSTSSIIIFDRILSLSSTSFLFAQDHRQGIFVSAFRPPISSPYSSSSSMRSVEIRNNMEKSGANSEPVSFITNWNIYSRKSKVLPSDAIWSQCHYEDALAFYDNLMQCDDSYVAPYIREALHCLEGACRLYGPNQVIGSYNGGKDAVVIMHLMRAAHAAHHRKRMQEEQIKTPPPQPKVIYFENDDEFPEVLSLLHKTVNKYELQMIAFDQNHSFSDGLKVIVNANSPVPMAFVLGTRKDDPNAGSQGLFAPSSDWMPPFMRVNPILRWNYGHVWHFLRLFQLPYCSLYDEGYTSLGTVKDTLPCPALARPQGGFWPAYFLREFDQERAGRIKKEKKALQISPSCIKLDEVTSDTDLPEEAVQVANPPSDSSTSTIRQKTVGLIIIGDEILKGLCQDTNTQAAAKSMREHNVPLSRVVFVSDDHDEIVNEIHRMHRHVDVIITSGGVGPTHDDVTLKSVSTALSSPLTIHKEMVSILQRLMKDCEDTNVELTEAQLKMATLPQLSKLRYLAGKDDWPVLQCRNIYVLPGVPQFFASKIGLVANHLSSEMHRSEVYKVVLCVDETSIVNILNTVISNHPYVSFGSYPFVGHPEYKTVVTMEGKDTGVLDINDIYGSQDEELVPLNDETSDARDDNDVDNVTFTKEEMDLHVKLALEELLRELPQDSVLRVDNDESLEEIKV